MSILVCKACGHQWDGASRPECPVCLSTNWAHTLNFVRPKHDPRMLSSSEPSFRSVMSGEFMRDSTDYLRHIASSGTVFQSLRHDGRYTYLAAAPTGTPAGSAVPPNGTVPSYALDCFVVADPKGAPHIYAESQTKVHETINAGSYIALPVCTEPNCDNLSLPGEQKCARHVFPALAD